MPKWSSPFGPRRTTAEVHPSWHRSGIFSIPLNDNLLDPFIRLFEALSNPMDAASLGELIMDGIYFRLLNDEWVGELRYLLQQSGKIQRPSRAVEYIHRNLDKPGYRSLVQIINQVTNSLEKPIARTCNLISNTPIIDFT